MGTDIHGWIEVRLHWGGDTVWLAIVDLAGRLDRNYDAFGCLFGVNNYAGFVPIAAGRGLPSDASDRVKAEFAEWDGHHPTWISATELRSIDWDERSPKADERIHEYRRTASGKLEYVGKSGLDRRFAELIERKPGFQVRMPTVYPEGSQWVDGNTVFRAEVMTRREALDASLELAIRLATDLAATYGGNNVRMVVWFDS